jgi:HTH-type transcriptional regulator / antitoxin HigA
MCCRTTNMTGELGRTIDRSRELTEMAKNRTSDTARSPNVGDRYFELIKRFPLRLIRSDAELDRAIAVVDSLIDRDSLVSDEDDYLDVLGDLVEKYESENHPMPSVSDAEMLRHLIETRETTQAKVSAETGIAVSTISEILAGKRGLNRKHIEALARHFRVSHSVFMRD